MAEEKNIATGYIGNALRSTAADHVTTFADEIFDTERQEYQNEVNGIVGTYIENPEFLSVKIDAEGKLLLWIEKDGSVNWSKGVPQPIQVKLQELEQKIKDNSEGDESVVARVTANEANIADINSRIPYLIDEEYLQVTVSEDNKILSGIKKDGTHYIGIIESPSLDEINKKIPTDEHIIDIVSKANSKDYIYTTPPYIFDIECGTRTGREFLTSIYPEGIAGELVNLKIDGNRRKIMKSYKNAWDDNDYNVNLQEINFTYNLGGEALANHTEKTKVYKVNRTVAQNKSIRVLCIGDSLTEAAPFWPNGNYGGRGWIASVKAFSEKDNKDIGNISVLMLGTRNHIEENFIYNSQSIAMRSFGEGRSGWATYGYANYPLYVRVDGAATPADSVNFMGAKGMYYLCGLATKTPTGSSTPSREWVDVPEDLTYQTSAKYQDILAEICGTPVGRYKPDYCATLWYGLQIYSDFPDRTSEYNGTTSDTIMENWLFNTSNGKMLFPDNPFYDFEKAKEDDIAFNLEKYLSRYKTLADDGITRLVVGETAGTIVSNVTSYDVCTPTHVVVALGTNDTWLTTDNSAIIAMRLLNACLIDDNIKVGWHIKRYNYVLDKQSWQDIGLFMEGSPSGQYNKNKKMMEYIGTSLTDDRRIYYIPAYFTHCNSMGINGCNNEDADKLFTERSFVSSKDELHSDVYCYCTIGHQVLAWIYYTLI